MKFRIVGVPGWHSDDGNEGALERKDAALLAFLAIEGPQGRGRVAALLWPAAPADRARNNLRQRIFRLKKTAGRDVVVGGDPIALAPGCVDPVAQPAEALARDPDALQGQLLEGLGFDEETVFAGWLDTERQRWRAARLDALAALADQCGDQGRLARALRYAGRLVDEDPLLEHAHRRLMRLHYLRGDPAAALAAYQACARVLKAELGIAPGDETEALRCVVLQGGPPGEPVPSAVPAPSPSPRLALPLSLRRPPRLVARDAEWRQLVDALAEERLVLVEGEPGSGKSRLLQEFAHANQLPPPVSARPGDEGVPYALAARLIESLCARAGPPDDPLVRQTLGLVVPSLAASAASQAVALEPARLLQAVEAALKGWRHHLGQSPAQAVRGLLLDDLQFADASSLELLLNLAAAGEQMGLHWVLATRGGELPAALASWCERLDTRRLQRVTLKPLRVDGVARFLDSLHLPGLVADDWAPALVAHCGGHPYFLVDTLSALHVGGLRDYAAGPAPVLAAHSSRHLAAMAARLSQLGVAEQSLIGVAAVAGQDFGVELAAAVMGCAAVALSRPWRALEQCGLFSESGPAHDLIRQSALEWLPQAVRIGLHRQVAQWLCEARDQGRATFGAVAREALHRESASDWPRAGVAHALAADEAHFRSAAREELQALQAAARCHRAGGAPGAVAAAFMCDWRAAYLRLLITSSDDALAAAEALLDIAVDDEQRAYALELRCHVRNQRIELEPALADGRAAMELARTAGSPRLRALAAQRVAIALTQLGEPEAAVPVLAAHAGDVAGMTAQERLYWAVDHGMVLNHADRRRESVAVVRQTALEAEPLDQWSAAGEAWGNVAIACMYLNDLQASTEASRRSLEAGRRAGGERGAMLIDEMTLLGNQRDLGEFDVYLARAPRLPQEMREAGYASWAHIAENDLAIGYAWLGRPELARQCLSTPSPQTPPFIRAARSFTLARLAQGEGKLPEANGFVREAQAAVREAGGRMRSYVRLRVALELARTEPGTEALQAIKRLQAEAGERELPVVVAQALLARVQLGLESGPRTLARREAAGCAREMVAIWRAQGPTPSQYPPETWWSAACALARDDPAAARDALGEARRWVEQWALPRLPEPFRSSFLTRNATNAAVLGAAAQPGWPQVDKKGGAPRTG